MTMQTWVRPELDRSEVAGNALERALIPISDRSPAVDRAAEAFWLYERHFRPDLLNEGAVRPMPAGSGCVGGQVELVVFDA